MKKGKLLCGLLTGVFSACILTSSTFAERWPNFFVSSGVRERLGAVSTVDTSCTPPKLCNAYSEDYKRIVVAAYGFYRCFGKFNLPTGLLDRVSGSDIRLIEFYDHSPVSFSHDGKNFESNAPITDMGSAGRILLTSEELNMFIEKITASKSHIFESADLKDFLNSGIVHTKAENANEVNNNVTFEFLGRVNPEGEKLSFKYDLTFSRSLDKELQEAFANSSYTNGLSYLPNIQKSVKNQFILWAFFPFTLTMEAEQIAEKLGCDKYLVESIRSKSKTKIVEGLPSLSAVWDTTNNCWDTSKYATNVILTKDEFEELKKQDFINPKWAEDKDSNSLFLKLDRQSFDKYKNYMKGKAIRVCGTFSP